MDMSLAKPIGYAGCIASTLATIGGGVALGVLGAMGAHVSAATVGILAGITVGGLVGTVGTGIYLENRKRNIRQLLGNKHSKASECYNENQETKN